jgi:hypothetical protein
MSESWSIPVLLQENRPMIVFRFHSDWSFAGWCLLGVVLLLLTACNSKPADSSPVEESASLHTEEEAQAYFHLVGELAGEPVTFDLLQEDNEAYPEHGYFRGFYRYDRFGAPIALYGSVESSGYLVLKEQGGYDQESHHLKGIWSETGYVGRWFSGTGREDYPFSLRTIDTGYVVLQYRELVDSLVAFPAWAFSPQASFRVQWLTPRSDDPALNNFVERAIAAGLGDGKLADTSTTVSQAVRKAKKIFFDDYRREMLSLYREGFLDSTSQEGHMPYSYLYEKSVVVYFNSDQLLTLGFMDYSYTGGAHGIYATEVKSFALDTRRQLGLDEILLPGYERALSEALARDLRLKYHLDDDAPLSEVLFEDKLEPNKNFGLTDQGLFFVYQPYEIAAYALGEIELFVSFDNIQDYLQEEWLNKGMDK